MTIVAVDGTALIHRYVLGPRRGRVADVLSRHRHWVVSVLALTEVTTAMVRLVERLGPSSGARRSDVIGRLSVDWDGFWQIPVDDESLRRAARLAADHGLGLVPSLQLAGFERLPRSTTILTSDPSLAVAAERLGFGRVELLDVSRSARGLLATPASSSGLS